MAANWTPNTVPNGPADVATFGVSNTTGITLDASTQLSGIVFNPGATGRAFLAINNTAATAIAGNFANLPDGSTVVVGANSYKFSYSGGDGNDLTLTVLP